MRQRSLLIPSLLFILVIASLMLGVYGPINPLRLVDVISGHMSLEAAIVERRLIRTVAALLVGVGLSASGAGLQTVLKNPLAEPYLLGVSAGAALGVLTSLMAGEVGVAIVHVAAFIGGLGVLAFILTISIMAGLSSLSLIVGGVAISSAVGAVDMMLVMTLGSKIPGALAWLFGTVAYAIREEVAYAAIPVSAGVLLLAARSKSLEALTLGDDVAESMGIRVARLRLETVVAATVATSGVVAFAGLVGFVGLVAPWIARLTVGGGFRKLYPAALAAGGAVTLGADVAARFLAPAGGAPLTAVTAIIGAPLIVYLLTLWGREH